MEENSEPRELGPETPDSPAQGPELSALVAEVDALRQGEETRATEIAALRAELATARQEQEGELTALRAQLADAQHGQLDAHRRAILSEHAGQIVDELVTGGTVEELNASVEIARAAFGRALEAARRELGATTVPVGASPRLEPSPEELSPIAKITAALSRGR